MLYSPSVKKVNRSQELEDLKYNVHKYSGLHPESYLSFENNLELMETELEKLDSSMAEHYLQKAVEDIEDLSILFFTISSIVIHFLPSGSKCVKKVVYGRESSLAQRFR